MIDFFDRRYRGDRPDTRIYFSGGQKAAVPNQIVYVVRKFQVGQRRRLSPLKAVERTGVMLEEGSDRNTRLVSLKAAKK
jgi:hypothetical protein